MDRDEIMITPVTTVKEILTSYPEVFPIFEKYGICDDCRTMPPPVPLGHFALHHCNGDVAGLIDELLRALNA
jgi:hypothetical protein